MDLHENEMLTRVGPGTAAGETLRKYWLPVGFSSEISCEMPKLVRWLGEDLLLFRDEFGRVGLIHPYCAHRGTSLEGVPPEVPKANLVAGKPRSALSPQVT